VGGCKRLRLERDIANNVPQEVVQWLHVNANPCNQFSCDAEARGGHLAMLQWLIDIGCTWSDVLPAPKQQQATWRC
jgi:hypothetical protein